LSFTPQVTYDEGGGGCPHTVALAPAQNVRVYSVAVKWDGSGAGGSFHPCLSIYSQDGKLLSRTRPEQVFAAGDSGVVTYAPFLYLPGASAPAASGLGFTVSNDVSGTTFYDDAWLVPAANPSTASQVTDNSAGGVYDDVVMLAPDGAHFAYLRSSDSPFTNSRPYAMDADGTNQTQLSTLAGRWPQWVDSDLILFQVSNTDLYVVNRDGTGLVNIVNAASLARGNPSPDGTRVAYIANSQLRVVDVDGTNDTLLASGLGAVNGTAGPVWRLDGSSIVFPNGAGMDTINPDGTGQTTIVATLPNGFWNSQSMGSDRMFLTDTSTFTQWRLGAIVFGSGYSLVSPTLYCSRATQRGVPIVAGDRVFVVQDGALMGGVDSLVSVAFDGSDLQTAFTPDESSSPLFQTVYLR
jgi:hypothetical protein